MHCFGTQQVLQPQRFDIPASVTWRHTAAVPPGKGIGPRPRPAVNLMAARPEIEPNTVTEPSRSRAAVLPLPGSFLYTCDGCREQDLVIDALAIWCLRCSVNAFCEVRAGPGPRVFARR